MADPTREEIDAKIDALDAKTQTKIARLEGKIDTAVEKISGQINMLQAVLSGQNTALQTSINEADKYNRDTRWIFVGLVVTCMLALAALIVGMATYGDALFGRGMNVRDVVLSISKELAQQQKGAPAPVASPPPASGK